MILPTTDAQLLAIIWQDATALQVRASLFSGRADMISDYLEDFVGGLNDLMADHLWPAEQELARNEHERDHDPKARRVNMPVETESPECERRE